jgi:hypothetical protein
MMDRGGLYTISLDMGAGGDPYTNPLEASTGNSSLNRPPLLWRAGARAGTFSPPAQVVWLSQPARRAIFRQTGG